MLQKLNSSKSVPYSVFTTSFFTCHYVTFMCGCMCPAVSVQRGELRWDEQDVASIVSPHKWRHASTYSKEK